MLGFRCIYSSWLLIEEILQFEVPVHNLLAMDVIHSLRCDHKGMGK